MDDIPNDAPEAIKTAEISDSETDFESEFVFPIHLTPTWDHSALESELGDSDEIGEIDDGDSDDGSDFDLATGDASPGEFATDPAAIAAGKRVALIGRFGGMNRKQAAGVLRSYNAIVTELTSEDIDWVVIGANESPLAESDLLPISIRQSAADGFLEIVPEAELWQRLGLVDAEQSVRQYYTPVTLAHLLGVSVRVIRRWHRRGLISAVRTLHRLPYFDFAEVASARRLAQWIASGASPRAIEQRLVDLVEVLPDIRRPLDQLSILVEGKHVLLRHGEGLLEPGGQLRFDFDAIAAPGLEELDDQQPAAAIYSIWEEPGDAASLRRETIEDPILAAAHAAEDESNFELAIDHLHAILARDGPRADICFQMAELLYRIEETIAARERYYMAIELDPDFVEARASLGNVLAETGQPDLAIAAYRGALELHNDYAEVHYHLARTLDAIGLDDDAQTHWRRFISLSPHSPWADEARGQIT